MLLEQNNKTYEIDTIYYYDSEKGQVVLRHDAHQELKFISQDLFGGEMVDTIRYIDDIKLNDQLERKVKLSLHNKNSFLIKAPSEVQYSWEATKYDLYINIQNNAEIVELADNEKEMGKGRFYVYKNYEIKGIGKFAMSGRAYKLKKITSQEEINKIPYSNMEYYKSVDDHIKSIKEHYACIKKDPNDLIEKYQDLKEQGVLGTYLESVDVDISNFKINVYHHNYETNDRQSFDKFVQEFKEYVSSKDTYMSDDCLYKFFKNYGIDYTKPLKK